MTICQLMFTPAFVIFQPFRGNFNSNQDIIYGKLGNINNKKPVNKQDLTGFNRISGLDILLKIEWKRRNTTSAEQLKKNQSRNSSKINRTVQKQQQNQSQSVELSVFVEFQYYSHFFNIFSGLDNLELNDSFSRFDQPLFLSCAVYRSDQCRYSLAYKRQY